MFGKLNLSEIVKTDKREHLEGAVARLLEVTEYPDVVRWVQFPNALLLFLVVPGDPESGAFYILDRKSGTWYWVDFDDQAYGGYSEADFECLMKDCRFARLVERPLLLETCQWRMVPGSGPELVRTLPQTPKPAKKSLTAVAARA